MTLHHTPSQPASCAAKTTSTAKPVLAILSTGHTFTDLRATHGDFDDWIAQGIGDRCTLLHIDATSTASLPDWNQLAGAVITGSHDMVTARAPWSERLAAWLRTGVQTETPLLGICYGHQLLAHAMHGEVGYHPNGMELGSHTISLHAAALDDALFSQMPHQFPAQLVHAQSVLTLPLGAQILASNAHEPHQAFRIGTCAWGVQFHPEFSSTAMAFYVRELATQSQSPHTKSPTVQETPEAASLLQKFANVVIETAQHQQTPSHAQV